MHLANTHGKLQETYDRIEDWQGGEGNRSRGANRPPDLSSGWKREDGFLSRANMPDNVNEIIYRLEEIRATTLDTNFISGRLHEEKVREPTGGGGGQ